MQARGERAGQAQFVVPGPARRRHVRPGGELAHPAQGQPHEECGPIAPVETGQRGIVLERAGEPFAHAKGHPGRVADHAGRGRDSGQEGREPPLEVLDDAVPCRPVEDRADFAVGEDRPQRAVDRLELELAEGVVQRRDATPAESRGQARPLTGDPVPDLAEFPEHVPAVGLDGQSQAVLPQFAARPQVLETAARVPEGHEGRGVVGEPEALRERSAHESFRAVRRLERVCGRVADRARGGRETVVVHDERALRAAAVRIGEDVLIDAARGDEVVEQEVARLGEPGASVEEREDLALVTLDEPGIRALIQRGPPELHPVFLAVPLDLAVAQHREARECRHDHRDAEVLVALAELLERRLLVRVAHEVDVALEDLGVEFEGLAHDLAVARAVLVAEHVHEGAVVDAMHPEGPDEVALQHPERLGEQQRARHLGGDPVDDLAPEFDRHPNVEFGLADRMFGA